MKTLKLIDQNLERWLTLIFYVMIVLVLSLEVLQRFTIQFSTIWGEEIARYCFIYLAWIGAAYAVKDRAHLRIDVIVSGLPNRVKAAFYVVADLMAMGLASFAFYLSLHPIQVSLKFSSVTAGLRVPFSLFLIAIPIGFGLIVIRLLQSLIKDADSLINDTPLYEGKGLIDG